MTRRRLLIVLAIVGGTALSVGVIYGGVRSLTWTSGSDGTDWSQFVPDTLSGLFTGAIVAVIVGVILSQRESAEARIARGNKAWARWTAMRANVAKAMPYPWTFKRFRMDELIGQAKELLALVPSDTAAELVEDADELEEKEVLARLALAVSHGPELDRVGTELVQALRVQLLGQGVIYDLVLAHQEVALALMFGNEPDELPSLMGMPVEWAQQRVPIAEQALAGIAEQAEDFMRLATEYAENWNDLRETARA
ncbi:MAG TPA: hypothetical protein VL294_12195 [Pseudolysinimonas sp.]|jgi:hypothetical protein|nr:hypothetical protein [Pseudolysinimonas sp.]